METTTTKTISKTAQTCKLVRAALKAAFPGVKFSVRTPHYGTINIEYLDGPAVKQVEEVVNKFENGSFDGMTDSYQYARDGRPGGARYIFVTRDISPSFRADVVVDLQARAHYPNEWDFQREVDQILTGADLRNGYHGIQVVNGRWQAVVPA